MSGGCGARSECGAHPEAAKICRFRSGLIPLGPDLADPGRPSVSLSLVRPRRLSLSRSLCLSPARACGRACVASARPAPHYESSGPVASAATLEREAAAEKEQQEQADGGREEKAIGLVSGRGLAGCGIYAVYSWSSSRWRPWDLLISTSSCQASCWRRRITGGRDGGVAG